MKRVLVVDDDPATTQLLEDLLGEEGYAVDVAPNGAVAIDAMPLRPPDVILVDLRMPVMDGVAFVRACRDDPRWAASRIVLLSADSASGRTSECFDAFVQKPFDIADLLKAVSLHS